jgi:hypothetical protein
MGVTQRSVFDLAAPNSAAFPFLQPFGCCRLGFLAKRPLTTGKNFGR